jgi:hypothetical protein
MLASAVGAAIPAGTVAVSDTGTITPVTVICTAAESQVAGIVAGKVQIVYPTVYTLGRVPVSTVITPVDVFIDAPIGAPVSNDDKLTLEPITAFGTALP